MSDCLAATLDDLASALRSRWHAMRFQQGDASVMFRTDRAEVMQVAIDTLYGYRVTRPGRARWGITVSATAVLDTARVAGIFTDAPLREIGPRLHARALSSARGQTYWVANHAMLINTDHGAASITVYCTGAQSAQDWAPRLIRQVMTAQLLAAGSVYAHAAAFSHRGRGVLVTGHRGAGKTTTLLTGLRLLGGDYVTNDRLLLRRESGQLLGRPWPAHLRIGVGSLLALPELAHLVPAELRELSHQRWQHQDKVIIEPPQFSRVLSTGTVLSETHPRLMLWPYLSPGTNAAPAAVPRDEVHDVLLSTRLFMVNPISGISAHINHWLIGTGPAARTAENLRQVAGDLAATVPCYRVPVGGDPAVLAARISELLTPIPPIPAP